MKRLLGIILKVISLALVAYALVYFFPPAKNMPPTVFGVSFSAEHARYMGLDAGAAYRAVLDEWKFRHIRLSAQWNSVAPEAGRFDFGDLEWYMDEAASRGAKVILAVGQKTPRWPECHIPAWSRELPRAEHERHREEYIRATVEHFKNHPALEIWQVENEPFLPFGNCPKFSREELRREIALVKLLDPSHPTLTSDSGELSFWLRTARAADLFGTTLYRVVWNPRLGYWHYDWVPAGFYRLKLKLVRRPIISAYITELQAEPWTPGKSVMEMELADQYRSMSIDRFRSHARYAQDTQFPRAYLWGAEWWYWLREKRGVADFAEYAKTLSKG